MPKGHQAGACYPRFSPDPRPPPVSQPLRSALRAASAYPKEPVDEAACRASRQAALDNLFSARPSYSEPRFSSSRNAFDSKRPIQSVRSERLLSPTVRSPILLEVVGYVDGGTEVPHMVDYPDFGRLNVAPRYGNDSIYTLWADPGKGVVPVLSRASLRPLTLVRERLDRSARWRRTVPPRSRGTRGNLVCARDHEAKGRQGTEYLTPGVSFRSQLHEGHRLITALNLWSSDWFLGNLDSPLPLDRQRRRLVAAIKRLEQGHAERQLRFRWGTVPGPHTARDIDLAHVEHLGALQDWTEADLLAQTKVSVNRVPLSDLLKHGEVEEAQGLEVLGPEAPEYLPMPLPGSNMFDKDFCYIPPNIQGADVFLLDKPGGCERTLQDALSEACTEFLPVFNTKLSPIPCDIEPMVLDVKNKDLWHVRGNQAPCRPQSVPKHDALAQQNAAYIDNGVVTASQATHYSQAHMTPKPHQQPGEPTQWRFCIDYRALNKATTGMGWPILNIKDMLHRLGQRNARFFC